MVGFTALSIAFLTALAAGFTSDLDAILAGDAFEPRCLAGCGFLAGFTVPVDFLDEAFAADFLTVGDFEVRPTRAEFLLPADFFVAGLTDAPAALAARACVVDLEPFLALLIDSLPRGGFARPWFDFQRSFGLGGALSAKFVPRMSASAVHVKKISN